MIISVNQPYFAPYAGFFCKACLSDILVILDDVQFPQGTTWISRNRFKNKLGAFWLSIPVQKKGKGRQSIRSVRVVGEGSWRRKHAESLRHAYRNAPYFEDSFRMLHSAIYSCKESLLDLNMIIIQYLIDFLKIRVRLVLLSELNIPGSGQDLVLEICRALGATEFLVQRPALKYMHPERFAAEGIGLKSFGIPTPVYPQLWGNFVSNLSMLDMVFNCGPKSMDILVRAGLNRQTA